MSGFRMAALVVFVLVVAALAATVTANLIERVRAASGCKNDIHFAAQDGKGDLVLVRQEICGGFAYSSTVSLELQRRGVPNPTTFFSFESGYSAPHVAWTAPDTIIVDIAGVDEVFTKLDKVGDTKIRYRIGVSYETAGQLAAQCASQDVRSRQPCGDFIAEVLASRRNGPVFGQGTCVPQGTPLRKAVELTKQWLRNHPHESSKPASTAVTDAMKAAYPCR